MPFLSSIFIASYKTRMKVNNLNAIIRQFSTTAVSNKPKLRGVVFDMDGTLTVPNLDFKTMYARCGVSLSEDLLIAVAAYPTDKKLFANSVIDEMEEEGRRTLELATGVVEMSKWLESHNIPCAMVTRNTRATVDTFFSNLWLPAGLKSFPIVLTRDTSLNLPSKPDPSQLQHIAVAWGISLPSDEIIMVGDSPSNDIKFGKNAGVATALVDSGRSHLEIGKISNYGGGGADICVESLALLPRFLWERYHIEGSLGSGVPLLKHAVPIPNSKACIAASKGDDITLCLMSIDELNTPDDTGNTPLIWAVESGHFNCVEKLLSLGVDIDTCGYLNNTACSRASRRGYTAILKILCESKANLNIPNIKMQFPLHFGAFKKFSEVVNILLAYGANPLVLDRKGRTPSEDTSDETIRNILSTAMRTLFDKRKNTLVDPK